MASIGQYLHLDPDDTFEASTPPGGEHERKFSVIRISKDANDPDVWKLMFPVGPEVAMCDNLIEELNIIRSAALRRDVAAEKAPV
jgi:hypothetical protein